MDKQILINRLRLAVLAARTNNDYICPVCLAKQSKVIDTNVHLSCGSIMVLFTNTLGNRKMRDFILSTKCFLDGRNRPLDWGNLTSWLLVPSQIPLLPDSFLTYFTFGEASIKESWPARIKLQVPKPVEIQMIELHLS